jgi:hypothetical protein
MSVAAALVLRPGDEARLTAVVGQFFGWPAPLAQLAEQLTLNQRVRGSSPWRRTRF